MNISIITIIMSIVLGISSNLLTPYVSKFLGKVSDTIRKRNEEKRKVLDKTVRFVLANSQEEAILRIRYLQRSVLSLLIMLIAFSFTFSSNSFQALVGFIIFVIANYGNMRAERLGKILDEVWKRKKSKLKGIDLD